MHFLYRADSCPNAYKAIDGQVVRIIRQLTADETDDVSWYIEPVVPIKGREGEQWMAYPHELTPYGLPVNQGSTMETDAFHAAIETARDLLPEPDTSPEYTRGIVEFIATLHGRPGVFTSDRMMEVKRALDNARQTC